MGHSNVLAMSVTFPLLAAEQDLVMCMSNCQVIRLHVHVSSIVACDDHVHNVVEINLSDQRIGAVTTAGDQATNNRQIGHGLRVALVLLPHCIVVVQPARSEDRGRSQARRVHQR